MVDGTLLFESASREESTDRRAAEEECGNPAEETDSVSGAAGVVETAPRRVGKYVRIG